MNADHTEAGPRAELFDGRSARGRPVRLLIEDGCLIAQLPAEAGDVSSAALRWPLHQVQWPERTRHGRRLLNLTDGAQLQVADSAAFDRWCAQHGPRESWVVRAQQRWRSTLLALMLLMATGVVGYLWGVPVAARGVVALLPPTMDATVGARALQSMRAQWLRPTRLPEARQTQLRSAFVAAMAQAWPAGGAPDYALHFHAAPAEFGPNAFALPGGDIVTTDELVELLHGHDDTLLGVMAHELGHVQHRHGMQALGERPAVPPCLPMVGG